MSISDIRLMLHLPEPSDRHVTYDGTHRPRHPDYLALSYTRKDKELTCNLQPMEESLVQLRGEHDVTPIDA